MATTIDNKAKIIDSISRYVGCSIRNL